MRFSKTERFQLVAHFVNTRSIILEESEPDDLFALPAIRLIDCAIDVVEIVPGQDIESVRHAVTEQCKNLAMKFPLLSSGFSDCLRASVAGCLERGGR